MPGCYCHRPEVAPTILSLAAVDSPSGILVRAEESGSPVSLAAETAVDRKGPHGAFRDRQATTSQVIKHGENPNSVSYKYMQEAMDSAFWSWS